jgi:transcriptional regulator with XRE-family HTH domain
VGFVVPSRPSREVFSENLFFWLQHRGKKGADLARALKVDPSLCSNWINARTHPEQKHYDKIAAFLNIPVSALFMDISDSRSTGISDERLAGISESQVLLNIARRLEAENEKGK